MAAAADAAAADGPQLPAPVVVHSDMGPEARQVCFDATLEALQKFKVEKDQAQHVKRTLEAWNGALWHVIIGTVFGASVAHDNHSFLLFRVGKVHVLCFQSFDEGSLVGGKKEHVARAVAKKDGEEEGEGGE